MFVPLECNMNDWVVWAIVLVLIKSKRFMQDNKTLASQVQPPHPSLHNIDHVITSPFQSRSANHHAPAKQVSITRKSHSHIRVTTLYCSHLLA